MEHAATLSLMGVLLLAALLAGQASERSGLPQVTVLLFIGVVIGPAGLDLLPAARTEWEPVVTNLALVMVGFLIGSDLEWARLRHHGASILLLAVTAAIATSAVVTGGLLLLGAGTALALALGGIAAATDVAATLAVIEEDRADGPLTRTLLGIVAVDDALTIALYSLLIAVAISLTGTGEVTVVAWEAVREIGGGVLLGVAVGAPAALLTGRIQPGRPTLLEALALVFLTAGLGELLGVSFLLAAIVAGAVVANGASHHEHTFQEIRHIDWPFLALFFLLAGSSFELQALQDHALMIAGYLVLRTAGKIAGGAAGARATQAPGAVRRWIGPSLLPQAGVSLGLALLAQERLPELAEVIVPIAVISSVFFELVGPVITRLGLRRSGEAGAGGSGAVAAPGDEGD